MGTKCGFEILTRAELGLIKTRFWESDAKQRTVIPILLNGTPNTAFPPLFKDSVYIDFRKEERFFANLFDLVLNLHRIPFDHPRVAELKHMIDSLSYP